MFKTAELLFDNFYFHQQLVYSQHFKQDIYEKTSGVQIPIEIYEGCKFRIFEIFLFFIILF
jgi:hypothetical protein